MLQSETDVLYSIFFEELSLVIKCSFVANYSKLHLLLFINLNIHACLLNT